MNEIKLFEENLKNVGISSNNQILGLLYHTVAMPTVLSFINKNESIIQPIRPLIKNYQPNIEEVEFLDGDALLLSARIVREYYLNASISNDDLPNLKTEIISGLIENESKNKYEEFRNKVNPYFTNLRMLTLLESIGELISQSCDYSANVFDVIDLGYVHSNFWKQTPDGLCFSSSVSLSNVLPTYLADVINSFPLPDANNSNPELWILSKEIHNRMHDDKYELDLETKKWIWSIHNYIFYINDPNKIELQTKYKSHEGLNEMLSDIFLNIGGLSKKLKSSKFQFIQNYPDRGKWKSFVNDLNIKVKNDFGLSIKNEHSSVGEMYWYMSYRFINAVMLYIKKGGTKKRFKFW